MLIGIMPPTTEVKFREVLNSADNKDELYKSRVENSNC